MELLLAAYCVSSERFGFWCEILHRNFSPAATFFFIFFIFPLLFVALWINTCLYPCLCVQAEIGFGREMKDPSSHGTCMGAWRKKIIWNEMDEKKIIMRKIKYFTHLQKQLSPPPAITRTHALHETQRMRAMYTNAISAEFHRDI